MKIIEIENGIKLEDIKDFHATHIFECGQCFRWIKEIDGSYTGTAMERVINVASDIEKSIVTIQNTNLEEFHSIWFDYFDLGRDYGKIKQELSKEPILSEAISHGQGMRILKQSSWEMLISFIVSANSNIPKISKSLGLLSELYGSPMEYKGKTFYAFPTLEQLEKADLQGINLCKAGFRCKYILDAVKKVRWGEINLEEISKMDITSARKELMKVNGVGPKVADCIMLFSMSKHAAYPVDVWVKRVTEHYFLGKTVAIKDIQALAEEKFGELAGFAQQYMFYFARETGLKV